jgi:hypothetical protein
MLAMGSSAVGPAGFAATRSRGACRNRPVPLGAQPVAEKSAETAWAAPVAAIPRPRRDRGGVRRRYGWRRLLAVLVIAVAGAIGWSGAQHLLAGASTEPGVPHFYVARPGDTIWGIAVRYSRGGDPRPLVDQLEAQTGGATLQPGEALAVP